MGLSILTPPSCEPLHVADVRQHIRQDITDDDNLISVYLGSARAYAEALTGKQFVAARYMQTFDRFPCYGHALGLFRAPLIEVESITYLDSAGISQTLPSADYIVSSMLAQPRIVEAAGKSWPSTLRQADAVSVTFKAGYVSQAVFDAGNNTVTVKNWRALAIGDVIRLSNSGGELPAGLKPKTDYYIQSVVSAGVYTLAATSGGAAIDLADAGIGLHFLGQPGISVAGGELPDNIKAWLLVRCDTAYSYRGEMTNTRGEIKPLPYVDRLLDADRATWI